MFVLLSDNDNLTCLSIKLKIYLYINILLSNSKWKKQTIIGLISLISENVKFKIWVWPKISQKWFILDKVLIKNWKYIYI